MVDRKAEIVASLKEELVRKGREEFSLSNQLEVRYVPVPHPEDLKAWLSAAYEAGRRDGAQTDLPEVTA